MKKNRKALVFLLISTLSISVYAYTTSVEPINKETSDKDKLTLGIDVTLFDQTPETLEEISSLIVEGVVVAISKPFEVVSDNNEVVSVFRYYYVKPNNIIKNTIEHNENDLIPIRVEGGETENLRVVFGQSPKLKLNDEKLFFLTFSTIGSRSQTNDYYFDVFGVNQGILHKSSSTYKNSLFKIDAQQLKNIKNKYNIEKSKGNNNSISLKKEFNIYGKSKLKKNKYSKYTDKNRME